MAKGDKDEKGKKDAVTKIMNEKSPADFTDKDIVDVKEDMVTTFLDNMKDDVKADKVLDTKEKQDKFVKGEKERCNTSSSTRWRTNKNKNRHRNEFSNETRSDSNAEYNSTAESNRSKFRCDSSNFCNTDAVRI